MYPADAETAWRTARRAVVGEPQAQGIRGIEEELLRGVGQDLLRRRHVERDVAFAGGFLQQVAGQFLGVRVGLPDQQAAPAAVDAQRFLGGLAVIFGETRLQAFVGGRLDTLQALVVRVRQMQVAFHDRSWFGPLRWGPIFKVPVR